jgi:hypothetical protein
VSMDIVGERGETIFRVKITDWCGDKPRFEIVFQGEKAEALDFQVRLRDSNVFQAIFYVQVKATAKPRASRYSGVGKDRRLLVKLKQADARKLGKMKIPAYVVGVDAWSGAAFIKHIPSGTTKGFTASTGSRVFNFAFRPQCRTARASLRDCG